MSSFNLVLCFAIMHGFGSQTGGQIDPFKPNYPPGALAIDRIAPEGVRILKGARHVEVLLERWARETDKVGYGDGLIPLSREPDRDANFAARIANLILEDAPYAGDNHQSGGAADPVFVLRFWSGQDQARLEIVPDHSEFRLHHQDKRTGSWLMATGDLRPIFTRMLPFLKMAFACSGAVNSLVLQPAEKSRIDTQIPASILAKIATIKPGMRRNDVLALFETIGGTSTITQRTYAFKGKVPGTAKSVLVTFEFSPPDQKVLWLGGRGYRLLRENNWNIIHDESPDDIITWVGQPQLDFPGID